MDVITNPDAGTIRKLRVARWVGVAVTLLLPLANTLLARYGLPALTPDDVAGAADFALYVYGGITGLAVWWAARQTRPAVQDYTVQAATGKPVIPADAPTPVRVEVPTPPLGGRSGPSARG